MPLKYYEKWVLANQEDRQISCVSFSPDGKYVAYGSREALAILTLESGELKCRVLGSSTITALAWLAVGGNVLLCTYRDGIISRFTIDGVSRLPWLLPGDCGLLLQDENMDAQLAFVPKHRITHFAVDEKKSRLATGAGDDIRIWHQDKEGIFFSMISTSQAVTRVTGWQENCRLSAPRPTGDNTHIDVVITAIHWASYSGYKDGVLIVSYKHHGIQ